MATPASVDSYIADLPPDRRPPMQALRSTIVAAAPRAIETIAYQMPALRLDGRFLVSYAAFKAHYSIFPASDMVVAGLGDELAPFLEQVRASPLRLEGLMAMPPLGQQAGPYFALLAELARRHGVAGLSMGMSADYQTAVMLGATAVRIGSALFED